jgi:hypothetical protein
MHVHSPRGEDHHPLVVIEFFENICKIHRVDIRKGLLEDLELDIPFETADL